MGLHAQVELQRYGWYPAGGGELQVRIQAWPGTFAPITLTERGELRKLWGLAAVSNLPSHIAQRMASRTVNLLKDLDVQSRIEAVHVEATGPGAGIFLFAEYQYSLGGFTAYGRKGLPSEQVAGMACNDLLSHDRSGAATDMHLADQLILPAAFAEGQSRWTTCQVTLHLLTNAWVVRQFLDVPITITGNVGESGEVAVGGQSQIPARGAVCSR
jgi:RNA 3'-terminal phosphate cyclase (ATP)